MPIVDLGRQQGFALIAEMTSTRNLLAYGIRVIRTGAFIETARDAILTMLSIGVEKLYKLTVAKAEADEQERTVRQLVLEMSKHLASSSSCSRVVSSRQDNRVGCQWPS